MGQKLSNINQPSTRLSRRSHRRSDHSLKSRETFIPYSITFRRFVQLASLWLISSFLSCQASGNLIFWPESAKNWDSVPAFRSWMSDKTTKNKLSLLVGQVSFLSTMMKLMTTGQSRRTQSEGCGQLPGIRQRACQEAKRVLTTDSANLKCCAVVARAWCVRTSTGTVKQRGPSTWKSEPFSNFLLIYLSLFSFQGQITHAKNEGVEDLSAGVKACKPKLHLDSFKPLQGFMSRLEVTWVLCMSWQK